MQLIKITHDHVQIKSDQNQIAGMTLNSAIILTDRQNSASILGVVAAIAKAEDEEQFDCEGGIIEAESTCTIDCSIIGSIVDGKFRKSVDCYPTTNVMIKPVSSEIFGSMIGDSSTASKLRLGTYASYGIPAFLDGNQLFQRHSALLGNTGSGKSVTVASILEKISERKNSNAIVFDVHGEYAGLSYVQKIQIGNTGMPFPIWFLPFRDMYTSLLRIKEEAATVQLPILRKAFYAARKSALSEEIPVQYDLNDIIRYLEQENSREIPTGEIFVSGKRAGLEKTVKGDNNGKLTSLISALQDKITDSRYTFMTRPMHQDYLIDFVDWIFSTRESRIKVIDLSDVPHDMIPTIIGVTAKLIYSVQLLQERENLVPIEIICDEAHVYIPSESLFIGPSQRRILDIFETIAKEGRKFGTSLMIVSQRPSEINKTILSQCANFIVLKLSNDADKQYVKSILPDGSRNIVDGVNLFSPGQCLVIGDSCEILFKICIDLPHELPNSSTIATWDVWGNGSPVNTTELVNKLLQR